MKSGKTDRRVMYTKMMLKDALILLMQTQHISSISVKSLCDIADINRSTFYAHFNDQYDLLQHIEQEVLMNLKRELEKQDFSDNLSVSYQALGRIFEYAKEKDALFKALLSENCDYAFQKDVMQLAQIVSSQLIKSFDKRTESYLQEFGITGCISVLQKWLHDGMIESPEEMSELILKVLYHGVTSLREH